MKTSLPNMFKVPQFDFPLDAQLFGRSFLYVVVHLSDIPSSYRHSEPALTQTWAPCGYMVKEGALTV